MTKLFKSTIIYSLSNFLPQVVSFFLLPIYSRMLTQHDYGILATVEMISFIATIVMGMSLERAAQRFYFDVEKEREKSIILSTFFWSGAVISLVVLSILLVLFSKFQLISSIAFSPLLSMGLLIAFLNFFSLIPTIYFQLSENPWAYFGFKIARFVINTSLILYFFFNVSASAESKLEADLLTLILLLFGYLAVAIKYFGFKFDMDILKSGIRYSTPFIPTLLIAWVLGFSSRLFIEHYHEMSDVGFYSMGYKLASVITLFSGAVSMAFQPIFYKLAASSGDEKSTLIQTTSYVVYALLLASLIYSLFLPEIVTYFIGSQYHGVEDVVLVLVFGNVLSSIMGVTTVLHILQSKNTKANLYASMLSALVCIMLSYFLVPSFGVYGAASANAIAMTVLFFNQYYFAKKLYYVELPWKKYVLVGSGIVPIITLSNYLVPSIPMLLSKLSLLTVILVYSYLKVGKLKNVYSCNTNA